jgi:hypothetical protein
LNAQTSGDRQSESIKHPDANVAVCSATLLLEQAATSESAKAPNAVSCEATERVTKRKQKTRRCAIDDHG